MTTFAAVSAPPGLVLRQLAHGSARALGAMAEAARVSERDIPEVLTRGADWATLHTIGDALGIPDHRLLGRAFVQVARMDGEGDDDDDKPGYGFVMSSATPDRARDIVQQDWALEEFQRNPVALWAHRYDEPAVGVWRDVAVRDGALRGTLEPRPVESYPMSVTVAAQLRAGTLRTVSVGFRPGNVLWRGSNDLKGSELYDERGGMVFMAPVLMECSLTPMPMNPDALADAQRALPLSPAQTIRAAVAETAHPLAHLFPRPRAGHIPGGPHGR
jgi:phage head maturation protease